MKWVGTGPGLEVSHIVHGFDWDSLGIATVVNVGGSHGSASIALCQEYPRLSCIVQDRAKVIEARRTTLPSSAKGHLLFMEPDFFFQDQPVTAASAYILRWTLTTGLITMLLAS